MLLFYDSHYIGMLLYPSVPGRFRTVYNNVDRSVCAAVRTLQHTDRCLQVLFCQNILFVLWVPFYRILSSQSLLLFTRSNASFCFCVIFPFFMSLSPPPMRKNHPNKVLALKIPYPIAPVQHCGFYFVFPLHVLLLI